MADTDVKPIAASRVRDKAVGYCRHATKTIVLFSALVLYFVLSICIYMPQENWSVGECLYYSVVVVTTVGYGDYLPTTTTAKVWTICFIHFGLSIVVLALGIAQDIIVYRSKAFVEQGRLGIFDKKGHRRQKIWHTAMIVGAYLFVVGLGTVVFGLDFKNHEDSNSQDPWIDGLYLTVVTLSTVGFGDLAPLSDSAKVFGCFLMLTGIPVFCAALDHLNSLIYTDSSQPVEIETVQGRFCDTKFNDLDEFVANMRKQGVGNYRDQGQGSISRLEFLSFILCKNGLIETTHVKGIMQNFDDLDADKTGFISRSSIGVSVSLGQDAFAKGPKDDADRWI